MKLTFAIADLHGRYDLMCKALTAVKNYMRKHNERGTVVFLGDYVDRGPDSNKIVSALIYGPPGASPVDWVCLKGNHEQMMVDAWVAWSRGERAYTRHWKMNGGVQTMASYRQSGQWHGRPHVVPRGHIQWLSDLPPYYTTNGQIFVHAGFNHRVPLYAQNVETMLWKLYGSAIDPLEDQGLFHGRHVVHGHHQDAGGPLLLPERTNLDTFAWHTGRLVIGVYNDSRGEPMDLIEVKGQAYSMDVEDDDE